MGNLSKSDASDVIAKAFETSEQQLAIMRGIAKEVFGSDTPIIIGVNGSLARRECTSGSDVDLFFLGLDDEDVDLAGKQRTYRAELTKRGIKMPALGGVFEKPLRASKMLDTIGGNNDTNTYITRRMLFLLEGEWVYNAKGFSELRTKLIGKYIAEDLDKKKIALFLLNDIIRYWRTICVDFEHKMLDAKKPRAIRIIKLRFSRMLLYFAGVAAISKTGDLSSRDKRKLLDDLFAQPAIKRVQRVFGTPADGVIQLYAEFLSDVDDIDIRAALEQSGPTGMGTKEYAHLSDKARDFKDELLRLLFRELGPDHEVVRALLL
jgi:predicted nucleotidyltransferase